MIDIPQEKDTKDTQQSRNDGTTTKVDTFVIVIGQMDNFHRLTEYKFRY
jgi:hypothetical protein